MLTRLSSVCYSQIDKLILVLTQNCKGPKNSQSDLAKDEQVDYELEDPFFPVSKPTYYTVTKTMQCWPEDTRVDQWNAIQSKDKPTGYDQKVFGMAAKTVVWRKNSLLTNDTGHHNLSV